MPCEHSRARRLIYDLECLDCGARHVPFDKGFWVAPSERPPEVSHLVAATRALVEVIAGPRDPTNGEIEAAVESAAEALARFPGETP